MRICGTPRWGRLFPAGGGEPAAPADWSNGLSVPNRVLLWTDARRGGFGLATVALIKKTNAGGESDPFGPPGHAVASRLPIP